MGFTKFPLENGMALLNAPKEAPIMTHYGIMNLNGR
jgi:hypothetical protein